VFDQLLTADVRDYTLHHSPYVLGLFEPVSGVMFLNVDDDRFSAWARDPGGPDSHLAEVFWHEAYHCFQVYATGYCYAHCLRLATVFGERFGKLTPAAARLFGPLVASVVSERAFDAAGRVLTTRARAMLSEARRLRSNTRYIERLTERAERYGETSIWGAVYPGLYAALAAAGEALAVHGPDGISARDVIECSAFLYGRDSTFGAGDRVIDATLDPEGPYQRLVHAASERCPGSTPVQIRAASALALRYERPGAAVLPLLERLGDARALARDLPSLPDAGAVLGTAAEVRTRTRHSYSMYDEQFERLAAWDVDELDLLTDPAALTSIPAGQLGFTLVTRGGPRGPKHHSRGYSAVMIGTAMLPAGPSVAKLRRDLGRALPV
jgi:hypothetical protein